MEILRRVYWHLIICLLSPWMLFIPGAYCNIWFTPEMYPIKSCEMPLTHDLHVNCKICRKCISFSYSVQHFNRFKTDNRSIRKAREISSCVFMLCFELTPYIVTAPGLRLWHNSHLVLTPEEQRHEAENKDDEYHPQRCHGVIVTRQAETARRFGLTVRRNAINQTFRCWIYLKSN